MLSTESTSQSRIQDGDSTFSEALSLIWLKAPDSEDVEDTKVTFAGECCGKQCLAMAE
jgi:hypothetical protein